MTKRSLEAMFVAVWFRSTEASNNRARAKNIYAPERAENRAKMC